MNKRRVGKLGGLSRRRFFGIVGRGLAGGTVLSSLPACRGRLEKSSLPFRGQVVTEDPILCHRVRDSGLRIYPGETDPLVKDVLIVGGGASGLAAARRLLQAGVTNILVAEKENELGGQSRAGEIDGVRFPLAAHFVESPHPRAAFLIDLYRELGIVTGIDDNGWPIIQESSKLAKPYVKIVAQNKWIADTFPFQLAQKSDMADYQTFYRDMFSWANWKDEAGRPAFGTPVESTSPQEEIRSLDRISMSDYMLRKHLNSKLLAWYVDSRLVNEYGTNAKQTSAWSAIHFWAASKGGFDDLDPAGAARQSVLTWPEGNQFLISGLAKNLKPDHLSLESMAVRIRNREHDVEVTLVDIRTERMRTVRARQVIYASQKNMIYQTMPELESVRRMEFRDCEFVPWVTAGIFVRQVPSAGGSQPAWDNIPFDRTWSLGYVSEAHVSRRPADYRGPTVLTFYGALSTNLRAERRELLQGGWDHWARLIQTELELMHPGITADIEQIDIYKWAHSMVTPSPGYLWGKNRQQMKQPFGRIHFANSDVSGLGVFEEAVYRGIEAAQDVLVALERPSEDALAPGECTLG
ncbi:MAG: FAD-dependent oxidoreductase [Proteobacteria bacterium]|nr:FAD-dependent oxidoreductase [Pseudomonadota bacterium]